MTAKFSSRPSHGNSLSEDAQITPSIEYNLFFDDLDYSLNGLLGESLKLTSYTVATIPDVVGNLAGLIFVSDEEGGAVPAWSNGVNWLRFTGGGLTVIPVFQVTGVNDITASGSPEVIEYKDKQQYTLTIVNTNTGPVTLDIDDLGAISVKNKGAEIISGEFVAEQIIVVAYNVIGPIFELIGGITTTPPVTVVPEVNTNSGTSVTLFSAFPPSTSIITVNFFNTRTDGTGTIIIQLGDTVGIEISGYICSALRGYLAIPRTEQSSSGFLLTAPSSLSSEENLHGSITLTLEDSVSNTWLASGAFAIDGEEEILITAGSKSLSSALTQISVTTEGGSDNFDEGVANVTYL